MKRLCPRCHGKEYRRVNRKGFWERTVLTFLGYFPWECTLCRTKTFLRVEGPHVRS